MPAVRSSVARVRVVLCGAAAIAACTRSDTTAPQRPLLTVAPARLVMRPGDLQRLALTTRAQRSLTNLDFWVEPPLGDDTVPLPAAVDGIGVVTATVPGTATVRILATADGIDTSASVPLVVRGIWHYGVDTLRLYFSAYGPTGAYVPQVRAVVDTIPVSQALTAAVADTTVATLGPSGSPYFAFVLSPRRYGITQVTVRSVAVPSLTFTVPVVVRYCLQWGSHSSAGSCIREGAPP